MLEIFKYPIYYYTCILFSNRMNFELAFTRIYETIFFALQGSRGPAGEDGRQVSKMSTKGNKSSFQAKHWAKQNEIK